MIKGRHCPTPRKGTYYDKLLAESIMLQLKYNKGADVEVYDCLDHHHIRDKAKRRAKEHAREAIKKEKRKKYRQLTIFDWMNELNGAQGI